MQRIQPIDLQANPRSKPWQLRTVPCLHLPSGDMVGAFVNSSYAFEDQARLSFTSAAKQSVCAEDWLYDQITSLDMHCQSLDVITRPLVLPAPDIAVNMPDRMIEACRHAVAQTRFCPQELSVELAGSAVATSPQNAVDFIHTFRRNGFRISIDARRHWDIELSPATFLMIDTLRFDASHLGTCETLDDVISIAANAGVVIVAENAHWRDAEQLESLGVLYAIAPKADA